MKALISFFIFLFVLSACNNDEIYKNTKKFPNEIWTYNDVFSSDFSIKQDTAHYDIFLGINHTENYPFQNIYLKITDDFTGSLNTDTININFYDKSGIIIGKKQGKNHYLNTLLRKSFKFPKSGNYSIKIEQLTRKDSLEGISDIKFKILQSSK